MSCSAVDTTSNGQTAKIPQPSRGHDLVLVCKSGVRIAASSALLCHASTVLADVLTLRTTTPGVLEVSSDCDVAWQHIMDALDPGQAVPSLAMDELLPVVRLAHKYDMAQVASRLGAAYAVSRDANTPLNGFEKGYWHYQQRQVVWAHLVDLSRPESPCAPALQHLLRRIQRAYTRMRAERGDEFQTEARAHWIELSAKAICPEALVDIATCIIVPS